jgi:hypothetical protein
MKHQGQINPERLVFIDETGTNMATLRAGHRAAPG